MQAYNVNEVAVLPCKCKDVGGAYVDPIVLVFNLTKPDGTFITYTYGTDLELIKDSVGNYHVDLTMDSVGFFRYKYVPTGGGALPIAEDWVYGIDESINLTTLAHVKSWAEANSDDDDFIIQLCIAAFSKMALNRTGRDTLSTIKQFTEVKDGNGSMLLFLRNYPIAALTSVQVNSINVAISTGYGVAGVAVHGDRRNSIVVQKNMLGFATLPSFYGTYFPYFCHGFNNVQVIYTAGYGCVPVDLEQCATEVVSVNYKRKAWQDLKSKALTAQGSGTTSYRDWEMSPGQERVIDDYKRKTF